MLVLRECYLKFVILRLHNFHLYNHHHLSNVFSKFGVIILILTENIRTFITWEPPVCVVSNGSKPVVCLIFSSKLQGPLKRVSPITVYLFYLEVI